MALPTDVWGNIGQLMDFKDWAQACGTSSASYAARRRVLAAKVHRRFWNGRQVNIRRLQLKKWSCCHSLYLSLWCVHETQELTPAEIAEIDQATSTLPLLHCVHIIGRPKVPLSESSIEGMLVSRLARHASVLTLYVRAVTSPLNYPNLQHLVLNFGVTSHKGGKKADDGQHLPSFSMLMGLRTLYLQSYGTIILDPIDLTQCMQLQHVAVQDIQLKGELLLPEKCLLYATNTRALMEVAPSTALLVSGLTICRKSACVPSIWPHKHAPIKACFKPSSMQSLKHCRLRFSPNDRDLGARYIKSRRPHLQVDIWQSTTPGLEELVVDVQGSLSLDIDPELLLKSLVLMAAGGYS